MTKCHYYHGTFSDYSNFPLIFRWEWCDAAQLKILLICKIAMKFLKFVQILLKVIWRYLFSSFLFECLSCVQECPIVTHSIQISRFTDWDLQLGLQSSYSIDRHSYNSSQIRLLNSIISPPPVLHKIQYHSHNLPRFRPCIDYTLPCRIVPPRVLLGRVLECPP